MSSCERILFYIPNNLPYTIFYRHDFVDVTLACADGSTLEAHKVILSSVSTYFRDILKVKTSQSCHRLLHCFLKF